MPDESPPSPFFDRHRWRVRDAAGRGPVVDLACGRGRHAVPAARAGAHVIGFDRNPASLAHLRAVAAAHLLPIHGVRADLETPHGIPVRAGSCGAILVFRFLFRPLAAAIREALLPGGLLLYETFTVRQAELGCGPGKRAFLLGEGELRALFAEMEILEYWEGVTAGARPQALARLAARRS